MALASSLAGGDAWALPLEEVLARADAAPEVAAARAGEAASQEWLRAAGQLPDPRLVLSVDDFAIEGDTRYRLRDSKRMVGLMQDIPAAKKREAERQQAKAGLLADGRMREFVRLAARREAVLAWIQLYFLAQKQSLLEQSAAEIRLRQRATAAALAGGGETDDALESLLDRQMSDDAFDMLDRDMRQARARLRRVVLTSDDAVLEATGELPAWLKNPVASADATAGHGDESANEFANDAAAELNASQARVGMAEAELRMAEADKDSDWSVEFGVGEDAMGKAMMMAKVNFSLPMFTASRQNPRIAAAQRKLEQSKAEHQMRRAEFQRQREEWRAEEAALTLRIKRLTEETLPLLTRKIALAEASYSGGRSSIAALILAREKHLDIRIQAIDLEAERAAVRANLYFLSAGSATQ
ncbi:MAG: TolC family protein [Zoogloeaceae bacterium]|nr:TolC family protein [Zoogloeaceae bacterium]